MSNRAASRLAWSLVALSVALLLGGLVLSRAANSTVPDLPFGGETEDGSVVANLITLLPFSVVGAIGVGGLITLWSVPVSIVIMSLALLGLPIFTGIAIVRYRLYDIDLLINRTLVYGVLTTTLVALYLGGVVVLQRIFVALTGEQSTLAVVASTLVIAALFNPLRRRIQSFIDRRFYRRKYDAKKTLEAFSSKLRDETDLEALGDDLVGVVAETLQPAYASVWLRPASDRSVERLADR